MLEALPHPIIFAHRGASAHAPENTMAAFQLAADEGAEAIELDAKLSKDGKVVVFHDATLSRTTDGQGRMSELTAAELRRLDAGGQFSQHFRGQQIPFLEEIFEAFGSKLLINVQITDFGKAGQELVERVCEVVKAYALESSMIFSSFHASELRMAARLLPNIPRCLLARRGWRGAWARSFGFTFGDYAALHPHVMDASPRQMQRVHRLRRRVHVWTINDPVAIVRMRDWGADGIFTDDPGAAVRALGRRL